MLETIYSRFSKGPIWISSGGRVQKLFLITTESSNLSHMHKSTFDYVINVNRLVLNGKHSQCIVEQIKSLIVRQDDFINFKLDRVSYSSYE